MDMEAQQPEKDEKPSLIRFLLENEVAPDVDLEITRSKDYGRDQ